MSVSPLRPPIGDDQRSETQAPGAAEGMEQDSDAVNGSAADSTGSAADGANRSSAPAITLTVNGEAKHCPAGLMLPQLLEALGYRPQLVVVEFNGAILPRQRWAEQPVVETDVLEVVTIVGGGS